jgi:hypothetical protein
MEDIIKPFNEYSAIRIKLSSCLQANVSSVPILRKKIDK